MFLKSVVLAYMKNRMLQIFLHRSETLKTIVRADVSLPSQSETSRLQSTYSYTNRAECIKAFSRVLHSKTFLHYFFPRWPVFLPSFS